MKKFKLKDCVTHLFGYEMSTRIEPLSFWLENHVSEVALESASSPKLIYGIKETHNSTALCKWDGCSHFYFTLNIPDTSQKQHQKLRDKDVINGMVVRMQESISIFIDELL